MWKFKKLVLQEQRPFQAVNSHRAMLHYRRYWIRHENVSIDDSTQMKALAAYVSVKQPSESISYSAIQMNTSYENHLKFWAHFTDDIASIFFFAHFEGYTIKDEFIK